MLSHRFTTSYVWVLCITATILLLTLLCVKQSVELRQARSREDAQERSLARYQQQSSGMLTQLSQENRSLRARLAAHSSHSH